MKGFFNKVLIIDVGKKTTETEEIPENIYKDYLGGKGLGTWLLLKHNPPGVDPLTPENCLIFAVGPACDVKVHGSARHGIFTKSPLTGLYCESYSGGTVADKISRTGYDAIILKGTSECPVLVEVSDEEVKFHYAKNLWGKEVYETEDKALELVGVKRAAAVVIGPGGENLVRFATIHNNYWKCAGRTGVGAVMGSKKVKAVVFHGNTKREPALPEILSDHWEAISEESKTNAGVKAYKKYGTVNMVSIANENGVFPTKYWQSGKREDYDGKINGEAHHERCSINNKACPRCVLACKKISTVLSGRHKGLKLEGPEYETIYAFGGLCMIEDIEEIMYLNDICDRLGIDTITAGNLVAFTMFASEKGSVDYKIEFGDVDKSAELLHLIAKKEGLGELLSQGIIKTAKKWGLEDEAIHVKGLEPAGYDPRPLKGMGLAYAVSDRGACHLRTTFYKPELSGIIGPDQIEGKAKLFIDYEDRCTIFDALILCRFFRDMDMWDELAKIVKGTTGMDLDKAGLQKIAANIMDLTRTFNLREGMTKDQDCLPKSMLNKKIPPTDKELKPKELQTLINDYYALRGWDENGVPMSY